MLPFQAKKHQVRKNYVLSILEYPNYLQLCRPTGQPCIETEEFDLVRNMTIAIGEERYQDAGIVY